MDTLIFLLTVTLYSWRLFLQDLNLIAQIIGVIAIVGYVIYTYKTFRQIKKQTDYQQDAYLIAEPIILKEDRSESGDPSLGASYTTSRLTSLSERRWKQRSKYLNTTISSKWAKSLKEIFKFDDNIFQGSFYSIKFKNFGNAEVNKIILEMSICVSNSNELIKDRTLAEKENYSLIITIDQLIARNGGEFIAYIISTASFPIYTIIIKGKYFDIRKKEYQIPDCTTIGENPHFHKLS